MCASEWRRSRAPGAQRGYPELKIGNAMDGFEQTLWKTKFHG
jgi:hypothetical protein